MGIIVRNLVAFGIGAGGAFILDWLGLPLWQIMVVAVLGFSGWEYLQTMHQRQEAMLAVIAEQAVKVAQPKE
jgi:hypothetical protein